MEKSEKNKRFSPKTAGSLMTVQVPLVSKERTIEEVQNLLFKKMKSFETVNYIYVVDEKGKLIKTFKPRDFSLFDLINKKNYVAFPSAYYKREVIDQVGPVDTYGNDFDYIIRIAKTFPIHRVEKVISNFRIHRESETGSFQKLKRVVKLDYIVSRRHGGRLFSHYAIRYYKFLILDFLHLEHFYYFIKKRKQITKTLSKDYGYKVKRI